MTSRTTNSDAQGAVRYGLILLGSLLLLVVSLSIVAARPDYSQREARIAALSPTEKDRLSRNLQRFNALDPAAQQRLIELETSLSRDPQSEALLTTLEQYYDWLKNLTPGQRYELRRLPAHERIDRVAHLYAEESQRQVQRQDRIVLLQWLEQRVLSRLPQAERDAISARPPLERRAVVMREMYNPSRGPNTTGRRGRGLLVVDEVEPADVDRLIDSLQSELKDKLRRAKDIDERRDVLRSEISDLFRHIFGDRQNLFSEDDMAANRQALNEFFERSLDDDDRDRLLSLPPDEMQRELRGMYFRRQLGVGDQRRSEFVSPQRGRSGPRSSGEGRDRTRRSPGMQERSHETDDAGLPDRGPN